LNFITISPRLPSGHEFWAPGVYVTRRFETAREYARPHQLFSDGTFYRCVVKAERSECPVSCSQEFGMSVPPLLEDFIGFEMFWVLKTGDLRRTI
jgi:hypothetical protein